MTIGIVGIKTGMTRIFESEGRSVPVTVIHAEANRVSQIKTLDRDNYEAIQVVHGSRNKKHTSKSLQGHFEKNNVDAGDFVCEFRLDENTIAESDKEDLQPGNELSIDQFFEGQSIDVTGISKGKGFAGVIKRWNFKSQDATHGNSLSHRAAGSIGQCQTPGKVFKGKKMAGHLGNEQVTVQNLEIVRLDHERNLMMIKGGIPGASGAHVIVRPSVKKGVQQRPVPEEAVEG